MMTGLLSPNVFIIAVTFFVAGMVKGVTGMGLPTLSMGVLGAFMSPVVAASLLIIPSFITNVWQLLSGPSLHDLIRRLWMMMLSIVIGTLAGTWMLTSVHTLWTTTALGAALVVYAAHGLFARPLSVPAHVERRLSPIIGLLTGAVSGSTGGFVIPAVPYLQALHLSKDDLIQALGLSFTVSTIALAAGLAAGGKFHLGNIMLSTLAILPALLGMKAGTVIRSRISVATFRHCTWQAAHRQITTDHRCRRRRGVYHDAISPAPDTTVSTVPIPTGLIQALKAQLSYYEQPLELIYTYENSPR